MRVLEFKFFVNCNHSDDVRRTIIRERKRERCPVISLLLVRYLCAASSSGNGTRAEECGTVPRSWPTFLMICMCDTDRRELAHSDNPEAKLGAAHKTTKFTHLSMITLSAWPITAKRSTQTAGEFKKQKGQLFLMEFLTVLPSVRHLPAAKRQPANCDSHDHLTGSFSERDLFSLDLLMC